MGTTKSNLIYLVGLNDKIEFIFPNSKNILHIIESEIFLYTSNKKHTRAGGYICLYITDFVAREPFFYFSTWNVHFLSLKHNKHTRPNS